MQKPGCNFYTYVWLDSELTPEYVGKGTGRRAYKAENRNKVRGIPPVDRSRILIYPHKNESEAFEHEKFLIAIFGRRDNGTGSLRNLTDGGRGVGLNLANASLARLARKNKARANTDEGRQRMRAMALGNKSCVGRVASEETRRKLSEAGKRQKLTSERSRKMLEARWDRRG